MTTVPNPYFINLELYWPNGKKPGPNEVARVKAYDVNGSVVTAEGESGYNSSTGGWLPVYMQNLAVFYPPREQPNLRLEVIGTSEQILHTTQVFSNIACNSTVRITIHVGAELVGDK